MRSLAPDERAKGKSLEVNLERQLNCARVAGELSFRTVEIAAARQQHAALCTGESNWSDVVQESANVLWVVENVEELCQEFNAEALGDGETLHCGDVDVVNGVEVEGVTAEVGTSAVSGLNVLGVRIVRGVTYNIVNDVHERGATRVVSIDSHVAGAEDVSEGAIDGLDWNGAAAKRSNSCPSSLGAARIQNVPVACAIQVQVGVDAALRSYPLTGLVSVYRSNFPVSNGVA